MSTTIIIWMWLCLKDMYRKSYDFEFNLEFICTSEFFKKYQNCTSRRRVQFELFEKFTSVNKFQIEREKSYDFFLIIHMQKFTKATGYDTCDFECNLELICTLFPKNCTALSQSESRNFCICIIRNKITKWWLII